MVLAQLWPLFGLRVHTPMLTLRYPDDNDVVALADLARRGVHDPSTMPFTLSWTDEPSPALERSSAQWFWRMRAEHTPTSWHLLLAAVVDGEVVGLQSAQAVDFGLLRQATTGSWLGLAHQGRGIGTEMRAAVLHLLFDGLGAERALSAAFHENAASRQVSAKHGYEPDGELWVLRRGVPDRQVRLGLARSAWESRRRDDIVVEGLGDCISLLIG